MKEFEIESEAELAELLRELAPDIQVGDWVWLKGDLGAGKTTWVRALLKEWGYEGDVPSPSFPLLLSYEFEDVVVYHLDAFRLEGVDRSEWDLKAWREGILLAEWPLQAGLKEEDFQFRLTIEVGENSKRRLRWERLSKHKEKA